jgi:hypothetical protein
MGGLGFKQVQAIISRTSSKGRPQTSFPVAPIYFHNPTNDEPRASRPIGGGIEYSQKQ